MLFKTRFKKISFATSLKKSLACLFNWDDEQLNNQKEIVDKDWDITPRRMCQLLGTEFLRFYCKDIINTKIIFKDEEKEFSYHIKKLFLDNKKNILNNENIIISDIRFQDEYDFVKMIGGITIKINRNVEKNIYSNHDSEININKMINFDYEIDNNFSLGHLYKTINLILEKFEK